MTKVKKNKKEHDRTLLDIVNMETTQEAAEALKAYIATCNVGFDIDNYKIMLATPPGTILDRLIENFKRHSDIPLEIPYFVMLHYLSVWLLKQGVTLTFTEGKTSYTDIWSIILASSGSGKTFTESLLSDELGIDNYKFEMPASAAKFIEDLAIKNMSLIVKDEFAQFLKSIKNQSYMEEMKGYLLQCYDNKQIERTTKKEKIVIEQPVFSFLGMTALESFWSYVTLEDLLDGFAQRFGYIIAEKDPNRRLVDFLIYEPLKLLKGVKEDWCKITEKTIHKEYRFSANSLQAFKSSFQLIADQPLKVPESFFRRIMYRSAKYALLLHIILCRGKQQVISKDAVSWSARIAFSMLINANRLIKEKDKSNLQEIAHKALIVYNRMILKKGKCLASDLVQNIRELKSVSEASGLLKLCEEMIKNEES